MFKSSPALLLPLALAACTTGTPSPPSEPAPRPPQVGQGGVGHHGGGEDACGAGNVQARVGQAYGEALHEQIATASGARQVRVMRPGHAYTMDYLHDRLNIRLDERERITDLFCG